MSKRLGEHLRSVRKIRGASLKAIAEPAHISTAYLQKLEGGEVRQPSPNVLHRLGQELDVPYASLMELAGYVVPEKEDGYVANSLDHALSSSDLTDNERKAVAAFVSHLREQRAKDDN
jgi:transcriptional regulator with XRE-family HTH domain